MTTTIDRPVVTPGDVERTLPDAPPDPVMEVFGLNVFYGDFHAVHDVNLSFGKHEITVKPLSRFLGDIRYLSGAAPLDDGRVALILDPGHLV